jgi:hypothetical protein
MRITTISTALALALAACSGQSGDSGVSDNVAAQDATCQVTFHWLQKDAYANTGGRTSQLWPPHTTTAIDITCPGQDPQHFYQDNHGSAPGQKDPQGNMLLVEARDPDVFMVTPAQASDFVTAYQACRCDPTSTFLTTNSLNDQEVGKIATELVSYVQQHLQCSGNVTVDQIAMELQSGDIPDVIRALSTCTWDNGQSLQDGFDTAARAALGDQLDSYHVCNNDAELQAGLYAALKASAPLVCDSSSDLCRGPRWYYTPPAPSARQ